MILQKIRSMANQKIEEILDSETKLENKMLSIILESNDLTLDDVKECPNDFSLTKADRYQPYDKVVDNVVYYKNKVLGSYTVWTHLDFEIPKVTVSGNYSIAKLK